MNIGIIYGLGLSIESDEVQVAAQVYGSDEVAYVEEITIESLNALREDVGCKTSELLVVTGDDLSNIAHQRTLYAGCQRLAFIANAKNMRKHYGEYFPV